MKANQRVAACVRSGPEARAAARRLTLLLGCALGAPAPATEAPVNSRLLATGGATQVEGQAGGGIVPWAVLAGYGSTGEFGASAFATRVELSDFSLSSHGAAFSYGNRIEVSVARQSFDISALRALGLPARRLRQNVLGAKLRLAGDLIYTPWPQVSLGVQYKHNLDFTIPALAGARRDQDVDVYLSATKLWLAGPFDRNAFANVTLRMTRANQGGLLGFGGDRSDRHEPMLEASAGLFLNRHLALGAEYRQHPRNLSFARQDAWYDVFVGFFPNKHASVVAAYADLGSVGSLDGQRGLYLSGELSY